MGRGLAYVDSGQYEVAIRCYNQALEINTNDSSIRNLLRVACEHVKQAQEGKEFLKRTVALPIQPGEEKILKAKERVEELRVKSIRQRNEQTCRISLG